MKTLLIILLSVTISLGASAQHGGHGFRGKGYYAPVTRVYVSPFSYGFGYGYPYFGYPYFGFPNYGYGYPNYRNREIPYKLDLQIQQIKNDYKGKIIAARNDKSLSGKQRRQEIRSLKTDRDKGIIDAKMNFRRPGMNNQNPGTNNQDQENQNPSGGSSNQGS